MKISEKAVMVCVNRIDIEYGYAYGNDLITIITG